MVVGNCILYCVKDAREKRFYWAAGGVAICGRRLPPNKNLWNKQPGPLGFPLTHLRSWASMESLRGSAQIFIQIKLLINYLHLFAAISKSSELANSKTCFLCNLN